jgi:hypothetical protein
MGFINLERKENKMKCENCKWWRRILCTHKEWNGRIFELGLCYGGPPTARREVTELNPPRLGPGYWTIHCHMGEYPTTEETDFCGMFQQRDE